MMNDPLCNLLAADKPEALHWYHAWADVIHTDLQDPSRGRKCVPRRRSPHMGDGDFINLELGLHETFMRAENPRVRIIQRQNISV